MNIIITDQLYLDLKSKKKNSTVKTSLIANPKLGHKNKRLRIVFALKSPMGDQETGGKG